MFAMMDIWVTIYDNDTLFLLNVIPVNFNGCFQFMLIIEAFCPMWINSPEVKRNLDSVEDNHSCLETQSKKILQWVIAIIIVD